MPPKPSPALVIDEGSRERFKEWFDQNPLRAWRFAQPRRLSILEAAERVGVGMSMIQMYERGVHKPGPKTSKRLNVLLGSDWSKRWDAWVAARPID